MRLAAWLRRTSKRASSESRETWWQRRWNCTARNLDLFIATRAIDGHSRSSLFNGKMLAAVRTVEGDVRTRSDWFCCRRDSAFDGSSNERYPNYWIVHQIDLSLCSLTSAYLTGISKRFF